MKIVITTSTYPRWSYDSTPDFVERFARQMTNEFDEVHVLAPHFAGAKTSEIVDGVHVHRYRYFWPSSAENIAYEGGGVGKIKKTPLYALKLFSLLLCQTLNTLYITWRYRISVINAHWIIPMGFIACVAKPLTRAKVVVTIHGGDIFSLRGKAMSRVKRWTLGRADAVVVNSSATKAEAEKLLPGTDYPIIPMGVDIDGLRPIGKTARKNDEPLRLLFIGRLAEEKGVKYLVDAVAELMDDGIKVRLTIAGTGPVEQKLKDQVRGLGLANSINFAGWVSPEDFPRLFAEHDVFVGPSIVADNGWQEAFGLVFAESLALDTPVIGTQTGGIKDIVTDEKNGLLVPERDSAALASAIRRLIDEPGLLSRLAENSRDDIANRFSWDICRQKYADIFTKILP